MSLSIKCRSRVAFAHIKLSCLHTFQAETVFAACFVDRDASPMLYNVSRHARVELMCTHYCTPSLSVAIHLILQALSVGSLFGTSSKVGFIECNFPIKCSFKTAAAPWAILSSSSSSPYATALDQLACALFISPNTCCANGMNTGLSHASTMSSA